MNNFPVDSFALSEDFINVFLIGKVRSGLSGDCILSGASLPGSRAEVVILSGPLIHKIADAPSTFPYIFN